MVNEILDIWSSGGWVMYPLFGLAVLIYSQAFQLVLYVRRTNLSASSERNWWEWVRDPERAEGRVRQVIEYTQSDVTSGAQVRTASTR